MALVQSLGRVRAPLAPPSWVGAASQNLSRPGRGVWNPVTIPALAAPSELGGPGKPPILPWASSHGAPAPQLWPAWNPDTASPRVLGAAPKGPGCADGQEEDTAAGHQGRLIVHGRTLQALQVEPKKTQDSTGKQRIAVTWQQVSDSAGGRVGFPDSESNH